MSSKDAREVAARGLTNRDAGSTIMWSDKGGVLRQAVVKNVRYSPLDGQTRVTLESDVFFPDLFKVQVLDA